MVQYIRSDLDFILEQIRIAESHVAAGGTREALVNLVGDTQQPLGIRTVDGAFNNLLPGQTTYGSADQPFDTLVTPQYLPGYQPGATVGGVVQRLDANGDPMFMDANGNPALPTDPGAIPVMMVVGDATPRTISNLIADMTSNNPAATAAYDASVAAGTGATRAEILDDLGQPTGVYLYTIPNVSPDAGLSAPFNSWMTLFGQFFDHGLDSINKGGAGKVYIQINPGDDLYDDGADNIVGTADDGPNFMVLTRASLDTNGNTTNSTTPFIDQNQTYGSHASQQALLRQYVLDGNGDAAETGKLIEGANGGMATWAEVKAQALNVLGIQLDDMDVLNIPLLATDLYGNLLLGPNGFAQIVTATGLIEGGLGALAVDASLAIRTGHAFLLDIAHGADPSRPGYNAALLNQHYIAGDGRANENIGLTAVHQVFHSEHNRLVEQTMEVVLAQGDLAFLNEWLEVDLLALPTTPAEIAALSWDGERLFQAAKFGTEMQYQHLVFEEFARKMQPGLGAFASYDATVDPAITSEFANVVYRFGHSMLNETVDRFSDTGADGSMGLIEAFLNPFAYDNGGTISADQALGDIARGMTRQAGNEIDEFVTDALRDNLLGLPLDLAALNIARGRDVGAPSLNEARQSFFDATGDTRLEAYSSWADFGGNLKHAGSLINFIAAYGTHASILAAVTDADKRAAAMAIMTAAALGDQDAQDFLNSAGAYAGANGVNTGLNDIDFWIGGLAEAIEPFGGMLGSTFGFVFETQLESLQNHDRFYYLGRLGGTNLLNEIENNTFSAMVVRNSDATHLPLDIFSTPAFTLEVDRSRQFNAGLGGADPAGVVRNDPATAGTDTHYLRYTGDAHIVLGGTDLADTIIGGGGDDAIWGDGGNDRIEGGGANDNIEAGAGDDIITDSFGDDVIRGGAGNDVIQSGTGLDLLLGNGGNDAFIAVNGATTESFGGTGNDFFLAVPTVGGAQEGNEGDDWLEGGGGGVGDNGGAPIVKDTVIGHDVFVGDGTDDRATGEGGDDIFVGSGGQNRMFGDSGYDWATYKNGGAVNVDLLTSALLPGVVLERFQFVEGLSGSASNDQLLGSDFTAANVGLQGVQGSLMTADGIARIGGLQNLLGTGVTSFGAGNIILGGAGNDTITGRGGDDIIDGDKWLDVEIAGGPNGPVSSLNALKAGLLNGTINPGSLSIIRTIKDGFVAGNSDTAVFVGLRSEYRITHGLGGRVIVTDLVAGRDGTDTLLNIEQLQFSDATIASPPNTPVTGSPAISDTSPTRGIAVTASLAGIVDPSGFNPAAVTFQWEVLIAGTWTAIAGAVLSTFSPAAAQVNQQIRVAVSFTDNAGSFETVVSQPTTVVGDNFVGTAAANTFNGNAGDDMANGLAGNDTLNGNDGNDTLLGDSGSDLLNGGTGNDSMVGGTDSDIYVVDSLLDIIVEAAGGGLADQINTTLSSFTLATNLENLLFTGAGDFTGTGNAAVNTITGGAGNDILDGLVGADRLIGLGGDDTYMVDSVTESITEAVGGGTDTMISTVSRTISTNVEIMTLAGNTNINATGNGAANTLNGNAGNNTLSGVGGADILNGGDGQDSLSGGTGNDTMSGGIGNDTLTGGGGNDIMSGGAGNDLFTEATANDVFVFETGFGNDQIIGFDSNPSGGQDILDMRLLGITFAGVSVAAQGVDTLITIGADTILLTAVLSTTIDANDFLF
jgi:Ca2+-binding RTX toxin-like protein